MYKIKGKIDTTNATAFEKDLMEKLPTEIDASELEYITSSGLRALMKLLQTVGNVTIYNVNPDVYEVFEITGFDTLLDIRK